MSASKLQHRRDLCYVVDVREASEVAETPLEIADENIPLGQLLASGMQGKLNDWKAMGKTIVFCCASGYRAGLAADQFRTALGFSNVASLSRGMIGLGNPAATVPDFLVVLATCESAEKLTLALNACAVAASTGESVVLALMGDGVSTFVTNSDDSSCNVKSTSVGQPFKPTNVLLETFLSSGDGTILACGSCVKSRKLEFNKDLLPCVKPMQMPDLLRMLGEAKKNLQFM